MTALDDAYRQCGEALRSDDPDRYFSTLFAPQPQREQLWALYAFSLEIGRIRDAIRDPMAGELRLQWWRDALQGAARGDIAAHPVASAILATIETARLPLAPFIALIDARTFDLYDDPMPSLNDLEGYAGETSSVLVRLAALILAKGRDPGGADAAGHAGVSVAMVGLMRALPWHARRGQVYIPADLLGKHGVSRDDIVSGRGGPGLAGALTELRAIARRHLAEARVGIQALPAETAAAFLPLALCEPYLALMERRGYDPLTSRIERPVWRNLITLWRAARRFPRL